MKAEVGVLSRNIQFRGDPFDSLRTTYGGHLMIHGNSSVARISQVEFYHTG